MNSALLPDSLDTGIVFKTYAVAAWIAGVLLVGWGPMLFSLELAGVPFGSGVVARCAGAVMLAVGSFAWAAGRVDEPWFRRPMLTWWAIGHGAALIPVVIQHLAVFGKDQAPGLSLAVFWLTLGTVLFATARQTSEGIPWGGLPQHQKLFEQGQPSVGELRSTYEQQIRNAAAQEERNRLARELHDSIKQQIFVIQTAAATAQARSTPDPDGAAQALTQIRASAREAMTEMEVMLDQLRATPLENAGLVEAVRKQCEALRFRTGADVTFTVGELPPNESLPPGAHDTVFRVAQEALANVARHARASQVRVSLEASPFSLQLRVDDNGSGFDPALSASGMGLGNMRTRAEGLGGTLSVTAEPGKGTLIRLSLPRVPGDVADLRDYRQRAIFWAVPFVFWAWMSVFAVIMPRERFQLAYRIPFALVHLWLLVRAFSAYLRVRKVYRSQLAKKAGAR